MKALIAALALFWGAAAYAGGAIGGSTGSKCSEYIVLKPLDFQRLVQQALSHSEMIFRGEAMEVEVLDLDEQIIQMRSLLNRDRSIIWYVEIRDWDAD